MCVFNSELCCAKSSGIIVHIIDNFENFVFVLPGPFNRRSHICKIVVHWDVMFKWPEAQSEELVADISLLKYSHAHK
jgi:hypothetical protein